MPVDPIEDSGGSIMAFTISQRLFTQCAIMAEQRAVLPRAAPPGYQPGGRGAQLIHIDQRPQSLLLSGNS
jgi:hypothetical protein